MADEVVQGLNDIEVAKWTRQTVADGSWMQKHTLDPLSARDVYLASAIGDEIDNRVSADIELQDQIDTLAMSTDVIDLWGSWSDFTTDSGKYFPAGKKPLITDNDIVKVLDDEHTIEGHEEVPSGSQTYWQWHKNTGEWEYVGYLNPYYSKSEIDTLIINVSSEFDDKIESLSSEIYEDIDEVSGKLETLSGEVQTLSGEVQTISGELDAEIDSLSSTVSSNYYLSGNVKEGNNLSAAHSNDADGAPVVTLGLSSDIALNGISSTTISATTASGDLAKFTNFSGTNISGSNNKSATIEKLITSAEGGSAANTWINNNTTDNSANSAINATNADHTKDVITSYYTTESQAGTQTATFNVSSLKLSGNKTAGVEISKTTNSNVDYLYFKLNSGTVCDFVEVQNKYVKYTDVNLGIGNKTTLTAASNSTAFGQYAAASTQSISFGFGGDASQINSASTKSFAVGDTNSANSFSYVFGNNNSADSLGFILGTNNTAGTASYVIGSNNKATNGGYIIGNNNTVTEQSVVLGNYAYTVAGQNNLLYVGSNNNTDRNNALLLNNNNLKLFNNMVSLDNTKGILFRGSNFIPYKELLGVSGYDSIFNSATNTDELIANQIYLYGTNYGNNYYNIFVDNLGANSHHFVFAPMLYSAYHFTFGVPVDYDICIKGVRLNQWPIEDTSNLSATFTDNAYIPAPGGGGFHWATAFPPNDLYFVRNTFSTANKNYVFFHINRLFGNQELNITIDYESKAFILIKGAGVNAGSSS